MFKTKNRNNRIGIFSLFLLGVSLFVGSGPGLAASVPSHRAENWQGFVSGNYVDSETIDFDGGAGADIDSDLGWILGFGYNFNENLALDFELSWNSMSYTGTRVEQGPPAGSQTFGGWLDTTSTRFNLTYNFMAKTITPFVSANVGWTWVDTNIPTGPPSTGCWWDPWWGYICSGYQPTYAQTQYTYGAAVGVRFDVKNDVFLRGSIGEQWVDVSHTSNTPTFTSFRVDFGALFGK